MRMRMALEFAKKDAAAFISHLDLQRAFSRAIRRSGLPVKLSEGFNPHYTVSFASALALGISSECECVEFAVADGVPAEEFLIAMAKALPPGLEARRAVRIKDTAPKLMAALSEAEYTAVLENADMEAVGRAVRDILQSETVVVSRNVKGVEKQVDIRGMIGDIMLSENRLVMRLCAAPSGLLRPEVVLDEIRKRAGGFDCRVTRTGLFTMVSGLRKELFTAFAA